MSLRSMKKLMKKEEETETKQLQESSDEDTHQVQSMFQELQINEESSEEEQTQKNEEPAKEEQKPKEGSKKKRKRKNKGKKKEVPKEEIKTAFDGDDKLLEEMKIIAESQQTAETVMSALTLKKQLLNPRKELAIMFEDDDDKEESKVSPSNPQYQLSRRAKKFLEKQTKTSKVIKNKLFIRSCDDIPSIIPKIAQMKSTNI